MDNSPVKVTRQDVQCRGDKFPYCKVPPDLNISKKVVRENSKYKKLYKSPLKWLI